MKVAVILENAPDCELQRQVIEVDEGDDNAVDVAVSGVIEGWRLSIGDTIKIREAV